MNHNPIRNDPAGSVGSEKGAKISKKVQKNRFKCTISSLTNYSIENS